MRVLIVGKYPPIEGGVSSHTYWLARGLGEAGHEVTIVTNAGRVESEYRIPLDLHDKAVRSEYEPKNVRVFSLGKPPLMHIPFSEAYTSRLVNLGLKALEERGGADVIYVHYWEPYAVAGLLLKHFTGLPLVVRHAGSDVYRLLRSDDFTHVFAQTLRRADIALMTTAFPKLPSVLGISGARVRQIPSRALPKAFSPEGPRYEFPPEWNCPDGTPLIAYLGKAARNKGLLELLGAFETLKRDFRFLMVSKGRYLEEIQKRVEESRYLSERVWFSDFVPPWMVPHLLRRTDLLVHLENRFPIPIHSPSQPYEAIACATPLLLSAEMREKLAHSFPDHKEQFFSVNDPTDAEELRATLTRAFDDPASLRAQADALARAFAPKNNWEEHVRTYVELFEVASRKHRFRRRLSKLLR